MEEDDYTRITLRIPKELHQKLTEAAKSSSKSMNAEIVARLDNSFDSPSSDLLIHTMARMDFMLADAETESIQHRLRVNELVLALKMAISLIPEDLLASKPEIRSLVEEWKSDIAELPTDLEDLKREVDIKMKRFGKAAEKLSTIRAAIAGRLESKISAPENKP